MNMTHVIKVNGEVCEIVKKNWITYKGINVLLTKKCLIGRDPKTGRFTKIPRTDN